MRIRHAALTMFAATLIVAGCSSDAEPAAESTPAQTDSPVTEPPVTEPPVTEPPATESTADGAEISIEGFAFSTADPVAPGTEITVTNLDGAQHTLTADDGSFHTGGLDGGATTTITAPNAPGTYTFICNIHPTMTGSLTVEG